MSMGGDRHSRNHGERTSAHTPRDETDSEGASWEEADWKLGIVGGRLLTPKTMELEGERDGGKDLTKDVGALRGGTHLAA